MSKGLSDEAIRVAEDVWTEDEPTQAEYELTQRILDVIDVAAREAAARQAGREEVMAQVEALADTDLTLCECGHDVGVYHNSGGCYHITWSRGGDDLPCRCILTDDEDVAAIVSARLRALVAEFRAPDATSEARCSCVIGVCSEDGECCESDECPASEARP